MKNGLRTLNSTRSISTFIPKCDWLAHSLTNLRFTLIQKTVFCRLNIPKFVNLNFIVSEIILLEPLNAAIFSLSFIFVHNFCYFHRIIFTFLFPVFPGTFSLLLVVTPFWFVTLNISTQAVQLWFVNIYIQNDIAFLFPEIGNFRLGIIQISNWINEIGSEKWYFSLF